MLTTEIRNKVNDLWNKFWSGGISNPLNAIEQITYLLFMKQLDENDRRREMDAQLKGEKYSSVFQGDFYLPFEGKKSKKNAINNRH